MHILHISASSSSQDCCSPITVLAIFLSNLLENLGFPQGCKLPVYEDSSACIEWDNHTICGQGRARHMDSQKHFANEHVSACVKNQLMLLIKVDAVTQYATSGALASSRDALRADSDLRAYRPCRRRDGTAGTPGLIRRRHHRRAASLSMRTTGRA